MRLVMDVVKDAGEGYGEILQVVKVKPATRYRIQGGLKVTQPRLGVYQVKLYKAGKEIRRISTDSVEPGSWQAVTKDFSTEDADAVQVLCRWRQNRTCVGQTAWFADVRLTEAGPAPVPASGPAPRERGSNRPSP